MQILPGKPIPIWAAHPGPTAAPAPPARSRGGLGQGAPSCRQLCAASAVQRARSWARTLAVSSASIRVDISGSCSLGIEEGKPAKREGSRGEPVRGALLQTPACPMAWALHPPQAPIRGVRPSSSIFLAYILQQYRDTPCARCRGAAAAPGAEAGPIPRLQPRHQWPRSRRRLSTGCGAQPPLDYGGPEGTRPAGGAPSPLCCTLESREPSGSCQLRPFSPALRSAANPRSKPGYRRGAESAALPSAQAGGRGRGRGLTLCLCEEEGCREG